MREDPAGLNYLTQYSYDPDGNLVQVNQGGQTRTFAYDFVGRLSSASNPESGTTNYLYDNNGNLTQKTDARGIAVNYVYDQLNRIKSKTYSDGTFPVTYTYDTAPNGVGRLALANASNSLTGYTGYDAMGRVTSSWQATQAQVFNFSYGYNLAGSLTSETYPSGRIVNTHYDGANRPIGVSGLIPAQQTTTSYVSSVNYAPHGGLWAETYGNNVTRSRAYNNRLQPSSLWDAKYNSPDWYLFIEQLNWGGANNGNLQAVTTYEGGPGQPGALSTFAQSFSYDGVNRLSGASDSGGWSRQFAYDQYGNMALTGNSGVPLYGTTPMVQNGVSPFNAANNRLLSAAYDQAGNQTQNGSLYAYYDAEERQYDAMDVSSNVVSYYMYDDQGRRVTKQTVDGPTVVYVYDVLGQKVAEYSTAASSSPCQTCYMTYDHLGSLRMVTDQNGSVMGIHDYLPFGEEIPAGWAGRGSQWGAFDNVAQKFTGKERDWQSGLDYFGARYYGSALGRFTSPDWSAAPQAVPYAKLENPQSLNLYSYVLNNPLAAVDRDGHACSSLLGNTGSGFCQRATEYANIDANSKVRSQTRFFAAASAVSQALADVATPVSGAAVSKKTAGFLEGVGKDLEKVNQKEAAAIQNGSLSGPNLDSRMVHTEQTEVQGQLDNLQKSDPSGYKQTISEINSALNPTGIEAAAGKLFPTDRAYGQVLDGVRGQLGGNIDFSKQGDREAIGNALINHIRQPGGSDVTGAQ